MNGVDTMLANLANEMYVAICAGITVASAAGGVYYAITGMWGWYEAAQFRGDAAPKAIATDLMVAAVLLGITGLFAANGGAPFQATPPTGYAVVQFQTGGSGSGVAEAANAVTGACFALLAAIGWLSQLRGVIAARELGRGRSDVTVWRVMGFLVGGAMLADLPRLVQAIIASLPAGLSL